jgi:phosphoribosylformimino-5-aminoimidazole carboxamide ribotide isomerase
MELICAIDLLDGGAVRLVQGDYERRVPADSDPASLARRFVAAGCRRLHVIDLAGARAGRPTQLDQLDAVAAAARAQASDIVIEAGGGLRGLGDVETVLAIADMAILGTAAIERARFLRSCADAFPGRIAASLDLRRGRPALDGWTRAGTGEPLGVAARLLDEGASRLIITETSRDGTLGGPDLEVLGALRIAFPDATLVAAGGVASLEDLRALERIGIDGAVVGLALLTGGVDPATAIAALEAGS